MNTAKAKSPPALMLRPALALALLLVARSAAASIPSGAPERAISAHEIDESTFVAQLAAAQDRAPELEHASAFVQHAALSPSVARASGVKKPHLGVGLFSVALHQERRLAKWRAQQGMRGSEAEEGIGNTTFHLYYYAQANPLRYVDPDGHFAKPSPEAAARLAALAAEAAAAAGGTAAGAGVATAAAGVGAGVGMVAPFATAYDYTHGGENRGIYNWARGLGDFLADFRPSDQPGPKPGQRTKEHLREALVVEEATGPSPALDPKRGMVLTPNPVPNADSMALPLLPEGHPVLGPEPGTANAGSSGSGGSNIITLTPAAEDPKPDRPDLSTLTPDFVVTADGEALTADFLRALAAAREAHLPGSGATPNSKGDLGQDLLDVTVDGRGTPAPHTARPTSLGPRIADEEVSSAGYEVKNTARPQSNTSFFRRQMAKEKELLQTKQRTRSEVISVNGFTRAAEATAKSSGVTPTDLRGYPDIRDFPFP